MEPTRADRGPAAEQAAPTSGGRLGSTAGLLLLALVASGALTMVWHHGSRHGGIDFFHYWIAPQIVRDHGGGVYDPAQYPRLTTIFKRRAAESGSAREGGAAGFRRQIFTNGSPAFYASLAPLVAGDYDSALDRFRAVSLLLFVTAVLLLCLRLGYTLAEGLAAVVALTLFSAPLLSDARVANVNQIQVASLALFLWLQQADDRHRWRQLGAGAVLGWALMFKANIAVGLFAVGLLWLVDRRWRKVALTTAGGAGGVGLAVAISWLHFGRLGVWLEWRRLFIRTVKGGARTVAGGNYCLYRLLVEHLGLTVGWPLAMLSLGALGGALWWGRGRGPSSPLEGGQARLREATLALTAGLGAGMLFSRLVWLHYANMLVPGMLALLRPAAPGRALDGLPRGLRVRLLLAATATACVMVRPVQLLTGWHVGIVAAAIVGGTLVLFALALRELATRQRVGRVGV